MHPKFSSPNITIDKFLMILHNFKSISVKNYKLFKRIHYILIILFFHCGTFHNLSKLSTTVNDYVEHICA